MLSKQAKDIIAAHMAQQFEDTGEPSTLTRKEWENVFCEMDPLQIASRYAIDVVWCESEEQTACAVLDYLSTYGLLVGAIGDARTDKVVFYNF